VEGEAQSPAVAVRPRQFPLVTTPSLASHLPSHRTFLLAARLTESRGTMEGVAQSPVAAVQVGNNGNLLTSTRDFEA
jgi:hypothetical protein